VARHVGARIEGGVDGTPVGDPGPDVRVGAGEVSSDGPMLGLIESTGGAGEDETAEFVQPTSRKMAERGHGARRVCTSCGPYGSMIVLVQRTVLSGAMARMVAEDVFPDSGSMASA
jgi:hypothetical protein